MPGGLTAANVVQRTLAAAHYCGPGGDYRATLDAKNPHLLHLPTKETYPLRWENGTLKLAAATCGAKEAKRVPARLSTAAATRVAAVPATRRSGKTEAQPSSAAAQGGCDERAARAAKYKEAKEKEKN